MTNILQFKEIRLADVVREASQHRDVIYIDLGSGVQHHRAMKSSVVKKVKVCALHKVPSGIPVQRKHWKPYCKFKVLGSFAINARLNQRDLYDVTWNGRPCVGWSLEGGSGGMG